MTRPLIFLDPYPRTEAMVYTPDIAKELGRMGNVVAHFGSRAPDSMVEEILPDAAIIVGQTDMPRERLDRARNLRAIVNVKANWEPNIDYAHAQALGVYVLSAAPAMAPAVAEYCLGQAIALGRGLLSGDRAFRFGKEAYGIAGNKAAYSLYDAAVGMVGFGNLGRALLPLLKPFTTDIAVHDPWLSDGYLRSHGAVPMELEPLLRRSRFLFVLAGVTAQNEGFLNAARLRLLPSDASVVLASRAEVVDFAALLELSGSGALRAAIDVYPQEPVDAGDAMRATPHVHFTAHLAGGMETSYQRIREMMVDDIAQILAGHPPLRLQRAEPGQAAIMRSR
jgi:phosphoglycerate dehydrogenase-like enzyme